MPLPVRKPHHPAEIRRGLDKFGVSPGYLVDKAYRDAHLDVVQDLGARWVRIDFNWAQIEPTTQGSFDWSLADQIVASCLARGLKILGVFIVSVPAWARSGGSSITLPTDSFAFATAINAVQARYPHIKHWQIGNEVNLVSNMSVPNVAAYGSPASTNPSGKAYAFLLRALYPRMTAQDPDCVVVTAGLAGTDTTGGSVNEVEFLLDFYDNVGQPYCDAIGAHPYTQPLRPGELFTTGTVTSANYQNWSAFGRLHGYPPGDGIPAGAANSKGSVGRQRLTKAGAISDAPLSTIRQLMSFYGDAHKKVWVTEIGAHTGTGGITQAEQVEHVKRAYALAQSLEWVGPVFWFSAKDLAADGVMANSWGLQTSAGVNKTAYATYKALAAAAAL